MRKLISRLLLHTSIKTKLRVFTIALMLPLVIMIVVLLFALVKYNDEYSASVRNVSVANDFGLDFKRNLDYKMYRYIIGGYQNFDEYAPFIDIDQARLVVKRLQQSTTRPDSLTRLKYISHFLDNLEKYIDETKQQMDYETSMANLENNIEGLTELINDEMYYYLFYETQELSELQARINTEIRNTVYTIGGIACLLFVTLWIAALGASNGITRPIEELCGNINMVGEGDFTVRPVASNNDEIRTLSITFDRMVGRIGGLVEDVRAEQENLRRMELQLLQAQINPHFLYNTFDTIVWLAEDHQVDQVIEMTTSLSNYFRTSLSKGRDIITLQEEERHVRSYLEIQQIRYGDILTYEISIPDELFSYTLPKLTLQPLVENALYHGIKHKREVGKIIVSGHRTTDAIVLSVSDNGIGMSAERVQAFNRALLQQGEKSGFGCANVNERIKLYFGASYGMHLESTEGVGTQVVVTLPA